MGDAAMDLIVLKISDYTFNITFLIALLLGFGVILIFASNRFNQPTYNQDDKDPATQFLPKYLATRHEYSRSLMYYVFSLETIFIILSFAGPKLLVDMRWIDNDATTFESFPLWIALI
ncbi:MAG TPA: hypothetical protein VET88_13450, partial [Gammaproteobacteria bacterium]|nr:hypothetical protein [Gammaproteobacteria bacterium]